MHTAFSSLLSEKMIQDFTVQWAKADFISHRYSFWFNNKTPSNNIWLKRSKYNGLKTYIKNIIFIKQKYVKY